jgi:hypothetical protein
MRNNTDTVTSAMRLVSGGHVRDYARAAETLVGACIAFPFEFAEHAHMMRRAWFRDTSVANIANALFDLKEAGRSISVRAVAIAAGCEDSEVLGTVATASYFSVLDALGFFLPAYQTYIECVIASKVLHGGEVLDAASVQELRDRVYRDYEPYPATEQEADNDLEEWAAAKFEGMEPDYPCKPALQSLIDTRMVISYEPSTMTLVAARPSMGKTHFLAGELINFAKAGVRGVFISADMSWINVRKRMVGILSGVDPKGDWSVATDAQKKKVMDAIAFVKAMPIVVHDNVVNVDRVCQIAKSEHYAEPIGFVMVDHIQLMRTTRDLKNPVAEMTEVSGALKHLSKVLGVPVIAASQLSRAGSGRADKRPMLSDLRESGALEQDATVAIGLYRPEYYGIEIMEDGSNTKGMAEVIVMKNQTGITGTVVANFFGVQGFADVPPPEFAASGPTQFPTSNYPPMPANRAEGEETPF